MSMCKRFLQTTKKKRQAEVQVLLENFGLFLCKIYSGKPCSYLSLHIVFFSKGTLKVEPPNPHLTSLDSSPVSQQPPLLWAKQNPDLWELLLRGPGTLQNKATLLPQGSTLHCLKTIFMPSLFPACSFLDILGLSPIGPPHTQKKQKHQNLSTQPFHSTYAHNQAIIVNALTTYPCPNPTSYLGGLILIMKVLFS